MKVSRYIQYIQKKLFYRKLYKSANYLFYRPLNQRNTMAPPNRDHILQTRHNVKFRYKPPRKVPSTDAVRDNVLAELRTP